MPARPRTLQSSAIAVAIQAIARESARPFKQWHERVAAVRLVIFGRGRATRTSLEVSSKIINRFNALLKASNFAQIF
jgi:hypothetical protein